MTERIIRSKFSIIGVLALIAIVAGVVFIGADNSTVEATEAPQQKEQVANGKYS